MSKMFWILLLAEDSILSIPRVMLEWGKGGKGTRGGKGGLGDFLPSFLLTHSESKPVPYTW